MSNGTVRREPAPVGVKPRIGFLGVGWIGRNRMEALMQSGLVEAAAIAEPSRETGEDALKIAPDALLCESLDEMLDQELDGIVIATPSALHAEQSIRALESGHAVFCQKPLGRNSEEVMEVIQTARRNDLLLGVDLSYRYVRGMQKIRDAVQSGVLGDIFAVDLVFHNAYGPDKAWFYDPEQAGGGCALDLGIHLIDLALWVLDYPGISHVTSRLFSNGKPLTEPMSSVDDYAIARIDLDNGVSASLATSWKLSAGCDALISVKFYGTKGGAELSNVNGSFYDFKAELFHGTSRELLDDQPDEWGKGAILRWAERLSAGGRFDREVLQLTRVAEVLDEIYGR